MSKGAHSKKIIAWRDGESFIYPSMTEASKKTGVSYPHMIDLIRTGKETKHGKIKGWSFDYLLEEE